MSENPRKNTKNDKHELFGNWPKSAEQLSCKSQKMTIAGKISGVLNQNFIKNLTGIVDWSR